MSNPRFESNILKTSPYRNFPDPSSAGAAGHLSASLSELRAALKPVPRAADDGFSSVSRSGRKLTVGQLLLIVALSFGVTSAAALAQEIDAAHAATRSATYAVGGPDDCEDARYELALPPRAIDITADPRPGHTWFEDGFAVARVSKVHRRNGAQSARWTISPTQCSSLPWSVGQQTFTAIFDTLSRKPPIKRGQAKRAAMTAITGKLGINWTAADKIRCTKRSGPNTRICKFKLLFASGIVSGKARAALFSTPRVRLYAKVKYRAAFRGAVTKRYRGSSRVSLGRYR
jgi:hypothetical protein